MNPREYLSNGVCIDWQHDIIQEKARELASGLQSEADVAKRCFEFVRDEIKHSIDHLLEPLTCKASEVLQHGTGICFAKSHLLAALLRANNIPAALCYQRLTIANDTPPYCLHGLNAVYLESFGWYRVDARGNKLGVEAQFCPPQEKLAFEIKNSGELDLPDYWVEPLPMIVKLLTSGDQIENIAKRLPDVPLLNL